MAAVGVLQGPGFRMARYTLLFVTEYVFSGLEAVALPVATLVTVMLSVKTDGYSILAGCGLSELKFLEPLWRTVFSDRTLSVLASHRKKVITVEPKIYRVQLIPQYSSSNR